MKLRFHLLLVVLLTACTSTKHFGCDEISAITLRPILSKAVAIEQLPTWLAEVYHISPQDIRIEIDQDKSFRLLMWEADDVFYTMHIRNSIPIGVIVWYNHSKPPSVDQVIICLGVPTKYRAIYKHDVEAKKLDFEMLFLNHNIRAEGWKFFRWTYQNPPSIDKTFPIYRLIVGELISVEEMLGQTPPPDRTESELSQFRPWPGNWQDIIVEIDPSIRP